MKTVLMITILLFTIGCSKDYSTAEQTADLTQTQKTQLLGDEHTDKLSSVQVTYLLEYYSERYENKTPDCILPDPPCWIGACGCVYCCYCVDHNNTVVCATYCDPNQCL